MLYNKKSIFYYLTYVGQYTLLFLLVIAIEQYTDLDIWLESFFYDSTTKTWYISKALHKGLLGTLVYRGYKDILIVTGIIAFLLLIYYSIQRKHEQTIALIKYIVALISIPLIVALLKPITNIYCPTQLSLFGGFAPYVRIFESYPSWFAQPHGRCFPAGHATSGFFLIITYYILQDSKYARYKWCGLVIGLLLGWISGLYQMARGEHFLSHTLATMVLSFFGAWCINEVVNAVSRKMYASH